MAPCKLLLDCVACLSVYCVHVPSSQESPSLHGCLQGSAAYVGSDNAVFDVPQLGPFYGTSAGVRTRRHLCCCLYCRHSCCRRCCYSAVLVCAHLLAYVVWESMCASARGFNACLTSSSMYGALNVVLQYFLLVPCLRRQKVRLINTFSTHTCMKCSCMCTRAFVETSPSW